MTLRFPKSIAGERFGRLIAVENVGADRFKNRLWRCLCDCGQSSIVVATALRQGTTRSCGCLHLETMAANRTKHGLSMTPEYRVWCHLRARCVDPADRAYPNYGGRGITVCDRWRSFENFLADMGERPTPKHSIDRKDNDGPYAPDNCRWATNKQQSQNKRTVALYAWNGRNLSPREISDETGVSFEQIRKLLKRGAPPIKAVTWLREGCRITRNMIRAANGLPPIKNKSPPWAGGKRGPYRKTRERLGLA